ncbi:MAG: hypothetical protein KDA58_08305 [Planctomycetaceae bacterium]|nr:hypothetical protein [Planctomycetaceae bacterium]
MSNSSANMEAVAAAQPEVIPPGSGWKWLRWSLVAFLCIVAAMVAYRYRPLNATERQLVGQWKPEQGEPGEEARVWFGPGRDVTWSDVAYTGKVHGDWHVSGDQLVLRVRFDSGRVVRWQETLIRLMKGWYDSEEVEIRIISLTHDRLVCRDVNGLTQAMVRVAEDDSALAEMNAAGQSDEAEGER